MISPQLEPILQMMYEDARLARYELVGLEHLLLALVQGDSAVAELLQDQGVDLALLLMQLRESIAENTPVYPRGLADHQIDPQPTLGFQRVVQRAMIHVQQSSQDEVQPADLLPAILQEEDSPAAYLLQLHGVQRKNLLKEMSHGKKAACTFPPNRKSPIHWQTNRWRPIP